MNISGTRLELTDDEVVLRADIHWAATTFDACIGVDRRYVGFVDPGSDPFVPVATIGAAVVGEDLHVEEPISAELRDGAQQAAGLYSEWWGHSAIAVLGATSEPRFPRGSGRGLFFTRGVDSAFSLLRSIEGAVEPFTHLIGVSGLEHWISESNHAAIWDETSTVADEIGLPIVRVTSNLRGFLDPLEDWNRTHGAFLATVALTLSPLFDSVVISSGTSTRSGENQIPNGSHSELDPLWSTERTSIVHYGSEFGRHEKTIHLARHREMLSHLKVCWVADSSGNCGRCEKCLRTMTALAIAGCTDAAPFDADLSPEAVDVIDLRSDLIVHEVLDELVPDIPDAMSDLRDAWVRVATDLLAETATGRVPVAPVCLPRATAHGVLAAVGTGRSRPVAWCLVDEQSPGAVALADGLTEHWGLGLCYLSGVPWGRGQPPGLPSVERILRSARIRVWWSDGDVLDVGRLTESVLSGCAPMQMMSPGAAELLRQRIPHRVHDCVVGLDPTTPPAIPDASRTNDMVRRVVLELVAGSLFHDSEPADRHPASLLQQDGG